MDESRQLGMALGALFRHNKAIPAKIRYWALIDVRPSGCWEWMGTKIEKGKSRGYGYFYIGGRNVRVVRWAYEYMIGPIPEGLELDHTCRNRPCVNPWHMEPITHADNCRRGSAKKAFCIKGHALKHPNLYVKVSHGCRGFECRECALARSKRYYNKSKETNNNARSV